MSKQIKDLERQLQKDLFVRGKEVTLTDEGQYLKANAVEIINMLEKTESNFNSKNEIAGDVFFGLGETYYMDVLSKKIKLLNERYPKIRIRLFSYDFDPIHERLERGILDIGLFIGPLFYDSFEYFKLPYEDEFCLIAPKDSEIAKKGIITLSDLKNVPLIASNQTIENKHLFDGFFAKNDKLHIISTYNLINNAIHMVKNGLGYALSLKNLVNLEKTNLIEIDFKEKMKVPLYLAIKRNRKLSKAAKEFLNLLLDDKSI